MQAALSIYIPRRLRTEWLKYQARVAADARQQKKAREEALAAIVKEGDEEIVYEMVT